MALKKFHEITIPDEMVSYLKESQRFNNIEYVSKYMSIPSLLNMLETGFWFINNPEKMNDLFEFKAFKPIVDWSKICFSSFITNQNESMAMWSMYAQPWNKGVMVSFPMSELKKLVRNTQQLYCVDYDETIKKYVPSTRTIPADGVLSLSRVAYVDGKTITCTGRDDRNIHFCNPYEFPQLAGYVKDAAWSYEKEIRLRVDLPDSYPSSVIFIKIPDSLLQKITITKGPRFEGNVLTALPSSLKSFIEIKTSRFNEMLAWIPCDDCELKKRKTKNT